MSTFLTETDCKPNCCLEMAPRSLCDGDNYIVYMNFQL